MSILVKKLRFMKKIKEYLLSKQDIKYRDFTLPLLPNIDKETFIGVRLPVIKKYAKELDSKTRDAITCPLIMFSRAAVHLSRMSDLSIVFIIKKCPD